MKKITVKASDVRKAIKKAEAISDEWQAQHLELLLQPKIYRHWQALNSDRPVALQFHPGAKPTGGREENLQRCEQRSWRQFAGYTLTFGYTWNSVADEWYEHSPSCCWDGVRRETRSFFIEALRAAYYANERGLAPAAMTLDVLNQAGVSYVNDLP